MTRFEKRNGTNDSTTGRRILRSGLRVIVVAASVLVALVLIARVLLTQPGFGSDPYPEGTEASPAALRQHVEFLASDVAPRNHRSPHNLDRAADYIGDALRAAGASVTEQLYEADGEQYRNVIARVGQPSESRIIVGAHYDAFGELPGADDNASGTAGLLELARLLVARNPSASVELVAYSTEEPPFFGSRYMGSHVHATSLQDAGVDVVAMIGLEMIGYFSEHQPAPVGLLRLFYPSRGDFILVAGRWSDRALIAAVKRSMRGASTVPVTSYCGPTGIGTDLSDHRNYWAIDVPAVMVTDTAFIRNPNYHKSTDTADTLDYDRMAEVVDGVANAVLHLSPEGTR